MLDNLHLKGNLTRGGGGGLRKFLDTRKGGSENNVGLGGGLRKFVCFVTTRRGAPEKLNF